VNIDQTCKYFILLKKGLEAQPRFAEALMVVVLFQVGFF